MDISKISVARWYDPFVSIGVALCLFFWTIHIPVSNTLSVFLVVVGVAIVQSAVELLRNRHLTAMVDSRVVDWRNLWTKWCGILVGVGTVWFLLWLLPEYAIPKYAEPLSEVKNLYTILILVLAVPTVYISDRYLGSKRDGTYELGRLALYVFYRNYSIHWRLVRDGLLEWILRGFFLVLNFTTAVVLIAPFKLGGIPPMPSDFVQGVLLFLKFNFLILICTIIPGYMFSSRLLGTEVRNLDRSAFGWWVTFICYDPLVNITFVAWLNYSFFLVPGTVPWISYLVSHKILLILVGCIIIAMELVHVWAEATLGIRSSNLMNRGVITTGPFRFTKHPVYVAKCIGWFFMSLPFMGMGSLLHNIQMSLIFLAVCILYGMRAWAEEKIFRDDSDYQRYAAYIDTYGIFSSLGRRIPLLRFSWRRDFWNKG